METSERKVVQPPKAKHSDTGVSSSSERTEQSNTKAVPDKFSADRLATYSSAGLDLPKSSIVGTTASLPYFAIEDTLDHSEQKLKANAGANNPDLSNGSPAAHELIESARSKIVRPGYPHAMAEYAQFAADVEDFESRSRDNHLPEQEIKGTFKNIQRLLASASDTASGANASQSGVTADGVQNPRQRIRIAEQLMNMAARPEDRNQGKFDTCAMAAIEGMLLLGKTAAPSKLTKMVADVALTGKTDVNGTIARVDRKSLLAHGEMAENPKEGDDKQRLAENIFRMTAANLYFGMRRAESSAEGQLLFSSRAGEDFLHYVPDPKGGLPHSKDLAKFNTAKGAESTPGPASTSEAQSRILNKITGLDYSQRVITNGAETEKDSPWVTAFHGKNDFDEHLKKLQASGQFPVVFDVFNAHELFAPQGESPFDVLKEMRSNTELDKAVQSINDFYKGGHSLLITDRTEDLGGPVYNLKNTWGAASNMMVPSSELYPTTGRVSPEEVVQNLVDWQTRQIEAHGIDRRALANQYAAGLLGAAQYVVLASLNPSKGNDVQPHEYADAAKQLKTLMGHLPRVQYEMVSAYLRDTSNGGEGPYKEWLRLTK